MDHYYKEVDGWFSEIDARFYNYLVDQVPDDSKVVELGTWKGRSLSCLLVEAKNSGKKIEIIGVDTFAGTPGEDCYGTDEDVEVLCRRNADRADYPYRLVRAPSIVAALDFPDNSLDAIFIDGDHSREGVLADLKAWYPKVKQGGIVSGHDVLREGVLLGLTDFFGPSLKFHLIGECWFANKD